MILSNTHAKLFVNEDNTHNESNFVKPLRVLKQLFDEYGANFELFLKQVAEKIKNGDSVLQKAIGQIVSMLNDSQEQPEVRKQILCGLLELCNDSSIQAEVLQILSHILENPKAILNADKIILEGRNNQSNLLGLTKKSDNAENTFSALSELTKQLLKISETKYPEIYDEIGNLVKSNTNPEREFSLNNLTKLVKNNIQIENTSSNFGVTFKECDYFGNMSLGFILRLLLKCVGLASEIQKMAHLAMEAGAKLGERVRTLQRLLQKLKDDIEKIQDGDDDDKKSENLVFHLSNDWGKYKGDLKILGIEGPSDLAKKFVDMVDGINRELMLNGITEQVEVFQTEVNNKGVTIIKLEGVTNQGWEKDDKLNDKGKKIFNEFFARKDKALENVGTSCTTLDKKLKAEYESSAQTAESINRIFLNFTGNSYGAMLQGRMT